MSAPGVITLLMKNKLFLRLGLVVAVFCILAAMQACWHSPTEPSEKAPLILDFALKPGSITDGPRVTDALNKHASKSASKIYENGTEVWPAGSGQIQTDSLIVKAPGSKPLTGSSHTMCAGFVSVSEFQNFMNEAKSGVNDPPPNGGETPSPTPIP